MNEIMPYYNQLYESTLIDYDPLATEFFKEGTQTERKREYEGNAKNRSKRGETTGEVFSSNEDTKQNETFGQVSKEGNVGSYSKQETKTSILLIKRLKILTKIRQVKPQKTSIRIKSLKRHRH